MDDHEVLETEGIERVFLKLEQQKSFHVIIGEDVTKQDPFVLIPKAALVDQLDAFTYSFDPVRAKILAYSGDELLLVYADADEADGHNFLVCVTEEAKHAQLQRRPSGGGAGARADGGTDGGADRGASELGAKPRRVFVSASPGAVEAEIELNSVRNTRPRVTLQISRQRKFFGAPIKFGDREAHDGMEECRPYKDPNFSVVRAEDDFAIQAVPTLRATAVQTTRNMPVAASVQTEPQTMPADRANAAASDPALGAFVAARARLVAHALQQNEAVAKLYTDAFASLDEEAGFVRENEPLFVEQLLLSEPSAVAGSLSVQPGNRHVVAVALVEAASLDDRIAKSNANLAPSQVYVWNAAVASHSSPQIILLAPADVAVVRFSPSLPHLVAGGLVNGQVVVWDLAPAQARLAAAAAAAAAAASAGAAAAAAAAAAIKLGSEPERSGDGRSGDGNSGGPLLVDYALASPTESCHRRPVTELVWMPAGHEVTSAGAVRSDPSIVSHQFVTSSFDGQIIFWDVNARKDITRERVWRPLLRMPFSRVSRPGDHALMRMTIEPTRSLIVGGTEDGELVSVDWRALRADHQQQQAAAQGGGAQATSLFGLGAATNKRKVLAASVLAHCGPVTAVARHPLLPNILLTAGDATFAIWQEDVDQPLVVSPLLAAEVTAALWSPTRASVLFVARADGFIEVWDLLEKSHAASRVEAATSSARITELELLSYAESRSRKRQSLAVTDESGALRVLLLPRALTRPTPRETDFTARFFARELERVRYVETVIVPQRSVAVARERTDAAAAEASSQQQQAGQTGSQQHLQHQQQTGSQQQQQQPLTPEEQAAIAEEKAAEAAYQRFKLEFERQLEMARTA